MRPANPQRSQRCRARLTAASSVLRRRAPQRELWELEAVLPQMEAAAKVPGVPGGQLWKMVHFK
jgi:hypothetical protein